MIEKDKVFFYISFLNEKNKSSNQIVSVKELQVAEY